jgi:hypothetical protein
VTESVLPSDETRPIFDNEPSFQGPSLQQLKEKFLFTSERAQLANDDEDEDFR